MSAIKTTQSICPNCLEPVPAEVVQQEGQVWMHKTCPTHGDFSALLSSDAFHYSEPTATQRSA